MALPMPTRVVLGISEFLQSYILLSSSGVIALVFAIRQYYKTDGGQLVIDRLLLRCRCWGT
jgi:type IV pilus assembly protein PilC